MVIESSSALILLFFFFLLFLQTDIEPKLVTFSADGADGKKYAVSLSLFGEIDVEKSKEVATDLHTQLTLVKKEEGPYWPRLLSEKGKPHYLKVCVVRARVYCA